MKSKFWFVFALFATFLVAFPAFASGAVMAPLAAVAATPHSDTSAVNPCDNLAEATRGKNYSDVDAILSACRKPTGGVTEAIAEKMPDAEEVTGWSQAAKGFAEALGIAAKQLGIAVNDFLNSPAGILLAVILMLNFAGGAVIGLPFTMFSLWLLYMLSRRLSTATVEYENVPVFWGFATMRRKRVEKVQELDGAACGTIGLGAVMLLILNIVVWVNVT